MALQVDPLQLITMIKQGKNPQQLMLSILDENASHNPMYKNLKTLAQNNQTHQIESIARNYARERGIDYDIAFNGFKQKLGL
jgi:hypothetical protein